MYPLFPDNGYERYWSSIYSDSASTYPKRKEAKMETKVVKTMSLNWLVNNTCKGFVPEIYKFLWENNLQFDSKKKIPIEVIEGIKDKLPREWVDWMKDKGWMTVTFQKDEILKGNRQVLQVKFNRKRQGRNQEDFIIVIKGDEDWCDIISLTTDYCATHELSNFNGSEYDLDDVPPNIIVKSSFEEAFELKIVKSLGGINKWLKKIA